jgi:peptide chain release factor 2
LKFLTKKKRLCSDFWNNAKEAELVRNLRNKKKWIEDYDKAVTMTDELELAYEFYREGELTAEELDEQYSSIANHIEAIEFKNMLSDEGDSLSAVLQITAGAGGTESCDWAEMLMRMYMMWGEKYGYKIKELNFQKEMQPVSKRLHLSLKVIILWILKRKTEYIA